jgi:hypothetical protein
MKLHIAARSRFSTSTVIDSEYLVPRLSAEGPLAYSPTQPPARDYFFQYTWILPGIFNPKVNLREHRYFGGCACPARRRRGFRRLRADTSCAIHPSGRPRVSFGGTGIRLRARTSTCLSLGSWSFLWS